MEASLLMLSETAKLRARRSGVLTMRANEDLFPKSSMIKCKLDAPDSMLKHATTIARKERVETLIQTFKTEYKKEIVDQAEDNAWNQEDQRLEKFITHAKQIATACATSARFDELIETTATTIPDSKLGIAGLWCYFKTLPEEHIFFTEYLLTKRQLLLQQLWNEFTKADSKPYLLRDQLNTIRRSCAVARILENDIEQIKSFNLKSTATRTWFANHQHLPENNADEAPQQQQLSTQPTANDSNDADNSDGTSTPPAATIDYYNDTNKTCIKQTAKLLTTIMEPAFLVVEKHTLKKHILQRKTAKMQADRKATNTHTMAAKLQQSLDQEQSTPPENMGKLMDTMMNKKIKQAMRKKSLGGPTATAAHPNVQERGSSTNSNSSKRKQPPKDTTQRQQQTPPNKRPKAPPIATNYREHSPPARGRGRGRGRIPNPYHTNRATTPPHTGRGRGGRGRGRGRGRSTPRGGRGGRPPGRGRGGRHQS